MGLRIIFGHASLRAVLISEFRRVHSDSMISSFHVRGRGGRFSRRDLKSCQSAVFQTLEGRGGGVDRWRLTLIAAWSL